jgi:CitMHS family citrate-Mg2+:H+ or citrate-Ca2+:H+ symporter
MLVPIIFGMIGGFGTKLGAFASTGIKSVASTASMLTFAIIFFGVMLSAGLFDPLVKVVLKLVKGDPLKIIVGTAILSTIVSLDGDGATTFMIVCSALVPVYNKLNIKKLYLAAFAIMPNSIINLVPWGGPTARIQAALGIDGMTLMKPLIPGMILALVFVVGVAYYIGLKERKRLGIADASVLASNEMAATLTQEEVALRRPKLGIINLILTVATIAVLISGKIPSNICFGVGSAIALIINYPALKTQRQVILNQAENVINTLVMVLAAGVFMGILSESKMADAIATHLISLIPPSLGAHMPILTGLIGLPGTYLLSNDAFYFGILPVLAKTGALYGFTPVQIAVSSLMGQAIHQLSPLVASIYILRGLTDQDLGEWAKFCLPWMLIIFVIYAASLIVTGFIPL